MVSAVRVEDVGGCVSWTVGGSGMLQVLRSGCSQL